MNKYHLMLEYKNERLLILFTLMEVYTVFKYYINLFEKYILQW